MSIAFLSPASAAIASASLFACGAGAFAQPVIEVYEQPNLTAEMDLALDRSGSDLLGDHVDLGSGALSFRHVDVRVPGNSPLPVEFARSYSVDGLDYSRRVGGGALGGWNIDVPFIAARVKDTPTGWQSNRCSGPMRASYGADPEYEDTLWAGVRLFDGQGGGQLILEAPTGGAAVYGNDLPDKVTTQHWRVDCGPLLVNGPGEGFEATSPAGWTYTFDTLFVTATRAVKIGPDPCTQRLCAPTEIGEAGHLLPTAYWVIRASRVEDPHGAWVAYDYDASGLLTRIHASDQREITISYTASGQVSAVTTNGRTWTYAYSGGSGTLQRVTRPDGAYWEFDLPQRSTFVTGYDCNDDPPQPPTVRHTHTVRHPSGVTGTFELGVVRHGRNNIPAELDPYRPDYDLIWVDPDAPGSQLYRVCNDYKYRPQNNALAVLTRTLVDTGSAPLVWSYEYQQDNGFVNHPSGPASLDLKQRIVTDPLGGRTAYYFNRRYGSGIEGELVRVEVLDPVDAVLRSETFTHAVSASMGDSTIDLTREIPTTFYVRRIAETTAVNGQTYTSSTSYGFDPASSGYSYGHPTGGSASSTVQAGSRNYSVDYEHNLTHWILGLPTAVVQNGRLMATQGYTSAGQRLWTDRFGVRVADFHYTADGTLAWYEDALGRRTTYSAYHRGFPELMVRPDGALVGHDIDDNGWLVSATDPNGATTAFARNAMGWLTLIDRPSGFSDTTISYAGLGSGLTQTVETGPLRIIRELDGFHRPTREERRAISNGGGSIFTRFEYDALGRTVFASFPSASSNPVDGVDTEYDALGRVVRTQETVAPYAQTLTAYLSDNRVQVTDPAGAVTTTWRSGYGGPGDGQTIRIDHPLGLTTQMTHDVWGNLLTARQHGSHSGFSVDETQSWAYDARLRLCRHFTAQEGHTLYEYDAANQVIGVARGAPAGTGCSSLPAALTVDTTYDLMGRVDRVLFPDSPNIDLDYDANGNLTRAARGGAVWTYAHDAMNRVLQENLAIDGRSYLTSHVYGADGRYMERVTPSGRSITYAPNGHGLPRRARVDGTDYASAALYHPSGALRAADYGNGLDYLATFNARQQIADVLVTGSGGTWLDHSYDYDALGRVTDITVPILPSETRSFAYDALGRLTTASGPWGAGSYTYDLLNNMREKALGLRTVELQYDGAGRLDRYRDTDAGFTWRDQLYDGRGNVTSDGVHGFSYDTSGQPYAISGGASGSFIYDAHRRRVKQTLDGETIYSVYGLDGTLYYRDNITTGETTDYVRMGSHTVGRMDAAGAFTWTHNDHLGSVAVATDAAGALVFWESHTPFGEPLQDPAANRDEAGFTGHIRDAATGLTYAQARYYNPVIARFYAPDPVGFASGGPGYFNRYAYTMNDPVNLVDPTGMSADCEGMGTCPTSMYGEGSSQSVNCGVAGSCGASGQTLSPSEAAAEIMAVTDFVPGVGDAKGFIDAAADPSIANVAAAVVGLVPVVGDVGGAAIKAGADSVASQGPRFFRGTRRAEALNSHRSADGTLSCAYCGTRLSEAPGSPTSATLDHIVPYSRGGPTTTSNSNPACLSCNSSKGSRILGTEWRPPNQLNSP